MWNLIVLIFFVQKIFSSQWNQRYGDSANSLQSSFESKTNKDWDVELAVGGNIEIHIRPLIDPERNILYVHISNKTNGEDTLYRLNPDNPSEETLPAVKLPIQREDFSFAAIITSEGDYVYENKNNGLTWVTPSKEPTFYSYKPEGGSFYLERNMAGSTKHSAVISVFCNSTSYPNDLMTLIWTQRGRELFNVHNEWEHYGRNPNYLSISSDDSDELFVAFQSHGHNDYFYLYKFDALTGEILNQKYYTTWLKRVTPQKILQSEEYLLFFYMDDSDFNSSYIETVKRNDLSQVWSKKMKYELCDTPMLIMKKSKLLLNCQNGRVIRIFDIKTGEEFKSIKIGEGLNGCPVPGYFSNVISILPDVNKIVCLDAFGKENIKVIDINLEKVVKKIEFENVNYGYNIFTDKSGCVYYSYVPNSEDRVVCSRRCNLTK